jgi:hypothetical protein
MDGYRCERCGAWVEYRNLARCWHTKVRCRTSIRIGLLYEIAPTATAKRRHWVEPAATFRAGHPALEESSPGSCWTHQCDSRSAKPALEAICQSLEGKTEKQKNPHPGRWHMPVGCARALAGGQATAANQDPS